MGLTCDRVIVAVWQDAILYSRLLMHSDAAGMATETPTVILVAAHDSQILQLEWRNELTNVTPDWRPVNGILVPNDRVDEKVQAAESGPYHKETCPRVPGLEMPGQWNQYEDETNESECREGGIAWVSHWKRGSQQRVERGYGCEVRDLEA